MKTLLGLIGAFAFVALVGCSESAVDADSSTQQTVNDWVLPDGATTPTVTPTVRHKSGDMVQDKPLTVIDYDGYTSYPIDGESEEGVSYTYTINGSSSTSANFGQTGPNTGDYYEPPMIVGSMGSQTGELCITFDQPTDIVEFAVVVNRTIDLDEAVTVDVYGPNNKLRGTYVLDLETAPTWASAWFTYDKNAVKKVCITFDGPYSGWAFDNLTFHQGNDDDD